MHIMYFLRRKKILQNDANSWIILGFGLTRAL